MRDITVLPSPYLTGVFDETMKENPNERWLASWETNRGCPFSCAYCDWGSAIASKVSRMDMDKLEKELMWFAKIRLNLFMSVMQILECYLEIWKFQKKLLR